MITRDTLMTLEAWSRVRAARRPALIAHRRLRSVALGAHMSVQFEDERTIRYQIQEMLRVERVFEADGIQAEIDAYAPLVPDGSNWKATLLLAYPDPQERHRALARLLGVERRVFVQIEGSAPVYAATEGDAQALTAAKTSAVHFLRFEFSTAQRQAIGAGAGVTLGCDHAHYDARTAIDPETLASLAGDLA